MLKTDSHAHRTVTFMGLPIALREGVLVPREETELLAREALALLPPDTPAPVVIDMCCGSGNLAVAIAMHSPGARVWASDLTAETTDAARFNCDRLGLADRVTVTQGDLFAPLLGMLPEAGADLIVANPPYISTGKLDTERQDLLEDEPREAFDGGPYGISILQRLISEAASFLKPGAWLGFEFGLGQERQVAALFKRAGAYDTIRFAADGEGRPRVALARKAPAAEPEPEKTAIPEPRAEAEAGPGLRPFAHADAPAVATLFVAEMLKGKGRASPALAEQFAAIFLDGPFADPACPARVSIDEAGAITGFSGTVVQTLDLAGATKKIAIGTTLMVRDHAHDPMTGARLLRALLAGPQDATLTETSSPESLPMWDRLGATVLPQSSLEWVRVLRPVAMGLSQAAARVPPLRLLAPLARPFDALAARRGGWAGLASEFKPRGGAACRPIGDAEFAAIARDMFESGPVRPAYGEAELAHVIASALRKSARGPAQIREIVLPGGKRLGAALYHLRPGGMARLHTLLAAPGQEGVALDAVMRDAREAGAAALAGRSEPRLFEPLSRRHAVFLRASATVIHTRDEALRQAFQRGEVPLNGLFGERWMRLIGDAALWS